MTLFEIDPYTLPNPFGWNCFLVSPTQFYTQALFDVFIFPEQQEPSKWQTGMGLARNREVNTFRGNLVPHTFDAETSQWHIWNLLENALGPRLPAKLSFSCLDRPKMVLGGTRFLPNYPWLSLAPPKWNDAPPPPTVCGWDDPTKILYTRRPHPVVVGSTWGRRCNIWRKKTCWNHRILKLSFCIFLHFHLYLFHIFSYF